MRLIFSGTLIILLVICSVPAWSQDKEPPSEAVDRLEDLEHQLAQAWVDGDQPTIKRIIAPDWKTTDIFGRHRSRDEVFNTMFGPDGPKIEKMDIDQLEVRLFGHVAVITGRNRVSAGETAIVLRFTDVAERRSGGWVFVASQGTPIVE